MTKQEYYDLLVESASNGTFPSLIADHVECLYRGPDGKKCAVGLLIKDCDYDPLFEGLDVTDIPARVIDYPEGMYLQDLQEIQRLHDRQSKAWDAQAFILSLNCLSCFHGVKLVDV